MISKEINRWLTALKILLVVFLCLGLVAVIQTVMGNNYVVAVNSMEPTFEPDDRLIINKEVYNKSKPKRGDLIVFKTSLGKDYIKRVIGVEGDTLEYKDNQLYINDKAVSEPYLEEGAVVEDFTLEQLTGETTIPKGKLWVMGDNRESSSDSRLSVIGFVDMYDVIGKINVKYYPINEFSYYSTR